MSLEEGNVKDLSSEKSNEDTIKELNISMDLMRKELADFKKGNNFQNHAVAPTGLNGDQMAVLIASVVKAVKTQPDAILLADSFVNEKDIDPDDLDEKGVLFCAWSTGYFIADDKRQGFPVRTPFGNVLHFKFMGQTKTRDDNGKVVLNTYSAYLSQSKKEQKWLREHGFFSIKFFETAKEALSADTQLAQKLARYVSTVMGMDQDKVLINCKSYGVPIGDDMRVMRVSLAKKMLEATESKQGDMQITATHERLKSTYEDDIFLGSRNKGYNSNLKK